MFLQILNDELVALVLQFVPNIRMARAVCTTIKRVSDNAKNQVEWRVSESKFRRSPLGADTKLTMILDCLEMEASVHRLVRLDLSGLLSFPDGIRVGLNFSWNHRINFMDVAWGCKHLEEVDLSQSGIPILQIIGALCVFSGMPTMRKIKLGGNVFSDDAVPRLLQLYEPTAPSAVQSLDLSNLGIYDNQASLAISGLLTMFPGLTDLDVSDNSFGEAVILSTCFLSVPELLNLTAHEVDFDANDLVLIMAGLAHCPQLRKLRMKHCSGVSGDGGQEQIRDLDAFFSGLALNNRRLQTINLCSMFMGPDTRIAELFARLPELEYLALSNCHLQNAGARAFGQYLKGYRALIQLELAGNDISAAGARALQEGVVQCTTLRVLWLFANWLGQAVCNAMEEAVGSERVRVLV
jgi:Ran GTPase-activating protein (RanGAP) involved in mRNA processing and transport